MPPDNRPRTVFAPIGDENGFMIALHLTTLTIGVAAAVILSTGGIGQVGLEMGALALAIGALTAWLLYYARWLRFTPGRLLMVRPWRLRSCAWEHVRHCDVSDRYLSLWLEDGDDKKLLRAAAETLLESTASRSDRRLALVLSELHGHRVPLAPDGLVWAVRNEDEDDEADEEADGDEHDDDEADARAAERLGVHLSDTDEPGCFYRPVPIDSIPAVRALWERAGQR